MPVTRSRTSSEQSAQEVVSDDLKQGEIEDKELNPHKCEVHVESPKSNEVEEVTNSANNNTASNEVTPTAATDVFIAEDNANQESTEKEVKNGVSQENYDRNDAKRKSEPLVETPDSTELLAKKAKVDEESKISESEEATPTAPVEASA